jgi:hypothetical protein
LVAAEVPTPHALQASGVCVRLGFAQRREGDEASDHVSTPPPLQNERRVPDSARYCRFSCCCFNRFRQQKIENVVE